MAHNEIVIGFRWDARPARSATGRSRVIVNLTRPDDRRMQRVQDIFAAGEQKVPRGNCGLFSVLPGRG